LGLFGRKKRTQQGCLFRVADVARLLPQQSRKEVGMKGWLQKSALLAISEGKILGWQLGLILTCLVSVAHARQNVKFDKS
jgi:hypothetical protein